ncbi:hypothetical protein FAM18133_01921 [Lacticaseibacillus paracasei]|nr:hypothetical protein FAM18133_01921 [Lacticaseibacillus paracasei]
MNNDVNATWPKLPVALKKIAIDPTSDDYELMCSNYFVTGRPKLILRQRQSVMSLLAFNTSKKLEKMLATVFRFHFVAAVMAFQWLR